MIDVFKLSQKAFAEAAGRPMDPQRSYIPPPPPQPATRQGQREIVAATLAAGMIAAGGKAALAKDETVSSFADTAAEAVAVWREVMRVAWPG